MMIEAQCIPAKPTIFPVKVSLEKLNISKRKRKRKQENRKKEISLKLMGNNVNSLVQKLPALEHLLSVEKPSAIFLQETRLGRPGRIKTPSTTKYTWYELHRTINAKKGGKGGGIAIGVLNSLDPSLTDPV